MPYRILCNGVQQEGAKLSPALASELFCYVPLHKIRYGVKKLIKSEDTQIGSNFIALYTPDTVIDPKKHTQTAGAKISFNITSTKKDFTDETEIVPTTSLEEAVPDTSVIPDNNPLLTEKTMKVYSFPADKTVDKNPWVYNAEALIKNEENMLTLTFYCIDYTNVTGSPTCQKLLKAILPTFQQSILPSSSKQK